MTYEHKLLSTVKTIPISEIDLPTGQTLEEGGIVFAGDRAGVVVEKIDDSAVAVCFDTQRDYCCDKFDEGNLPTGAGKKIYLNAADGKLTKNESGNKFVGYFWKKMGNVIIFSLHG